MLNKINTGTILLIIISFFGNIFPNVATVKNSNGKAYFSMNDEAAIYCLSNLQSNKIIDGIGSGRYFTVSKDGNLIGFKIITNDGLQIPHIYNFITNKSIPLNSPVPLAGQVSFSDDNKMCYTIGDTLVIKQNEKKNTYKLPSYTNIASISPDGNYVCFCNIKDQILLLDISTGYIKQLTISDTGYYNPQWSPDSKTILFTSINGCINTLNISQNIITNFGRGSSATWIDNENIILLENSNIVKINVMDKLRNNILIGVNISKISYNNGSLVTFNSTDTITTYSLIDSKIRVKSQISVTVPKLLKKNNKQSYNINSDYYIDNVPYVHQVYDTPDWHWGHSSCAPTAAVMVLAYYNVLPKWPTQVSSLGLHTTNWGSYICDKYHFMGFDYDKGKVVSQTHNTAYGGYSFMWNNSSPYDKMHSYFYYHGLQASRVDVPNYSDAENEIKNGRPVSLCVLLTTAGHLIVARGIEKQGTLIFNDPYGNKNLESSANYPNRYGENAKYDWPGYNNGFVNLDVNTTTSDPYGVDWLVKTSFTRPCEADTLVDDLQLNELGFTINTTIPQVLSSPWRFMDMWRDSKTGGYNNGHYWWNSTCLNSDTCYATWIPNLPKEGKYTVKAYVPSVSTAKSVTYTIKNQSESYNVVISQKDSASLWMNLGTYYFNKGKVNSVKLGNHSLYRSEKITYDAIKFVSNDVTASEKLNNKIINYNVINCYPNPFNPETKIEYNISKPCFLKINIFDIRGKNIKSVYNGNIMPGKYSTVFSGVGLSSGVYICKLEALGEVITKKLILVK